MRRSAAIAAKWERTARDPQARALAEQQAMSEAIQSSGQSW
ncbi:MAG: hypothetical protein ACRDTX_27305 [Pseudonocardiaceae bacterium]